MEKSAKVMERIRDCVCPATNVTVCLLCRVIRKGKFVKVRACSIMARCRHRTSLCLVNKTFE